MICPVCKKECSDRDKRNRIRKVCSRECSLVLGRGKTGTVPIYVNCSYCGTKTRKSPSDIKHSKSQKWYCNKSCKAKTEVRKIPVIGICGYCKKEIVRSPSGFKKNGKDTIVVFCNRKCFGKYLRQWTGDKSFNWRGGYNKTERERIRSRIAWKELRQQILQSQDFTCAVCKIFGKTLHIHHIVPYRLGGKDKIENLVALCAQCHSRQTVKDWEKENRQSWAMGGAHICRKGGDIYVGEVLYG